MERTTIKPERLFQKSTVAVKTRKDYGTGFFVAPGFVLTCRHVIEDSPQQVSVVWDNTEEPAHVISCLDADVDPDIALLGVRIVDHYCALLHQSELTPGDRLYIYGYPERDKNVGKGIAPEYGGESDNGKEFTIQSEHIRKGHSGSPVLHYSAEKVCGMVVRDRILQSSHDRTLGGIALSAETIMRCWPKLIRKPAAIQVIWETKSIGVLGKLLESFMCPSIALNPWQLLNNSNKHSEMQIENMIRNWARKIHFSLSPTATEIQQMLDRLITWPGFAPEMLREHLLLPQSDLRMEICRTFATMNFHRYAPFSDCFSLFLYTCTSAQEFLGFVDAELIRQKFVNFADEFILNKLVKIYASE